MDELFVPLLGVIATLQVFQLGLLLRAAIVMAVLSTQIDNLARAVDRLSRTRAL